MQGPRGPASQPLTETPNSYREIRNGLPPSLQNSGRFGVERLLSVYFVADSTHVLS